jgi:hypothetical protein
MWDIELRKYTTRTPTRLTCAEGNVEESDSASSRSVRRSGRPHGTSRIFMQENRETSETPAVPTDNSRRAKAQAARPACTFARSHTAAK